MRFADAEPIVRATLYEGYVLYPYRPSSIKNRQRWAFGGLDRGEVMRAECVVTGDEATRVAIRVRFLHLGERDGWHEAVEREVQLPETTLGALRTTHVERFERMPEPDAPLHQRPVRGEIRCEAIPDDGAWRLAIVVENRGEGGALGTLSSVHVLIGVEGGALVSLTDPPPALAAVAARCRNQGCWPVLVGAPGSCDLVLASPIILYDHPRVAPESPGDLFDATEIDEILSLRILTMTDAEKREARASDPRVARLIDRTEALGPRELMQLHGVLRRDDRPLRAGDRVRLRPRDRADAFDLLLDGRAATVVGVQQDVEDRVYVTVTIDDDPGKDLGESGQPGHRFFFGLHEVERL